MSRSHWIEKIEKSFREFKMEGNYSSYNLKDGFVYYHSKTVARKDHAGWKIHISFDKKCIEDAFLIGLNILRKINLSFKFKLPNEAKSNHCFDDSQFTVYLNADFGAKKMEELIDEVTKQFQEKNIKPSIALPISDCSTRSPYVTFRNSLFVPFGATKGYYLTPRHVGKHFNPCRYDNPYKKMAARDETPFDFQSHFERFEAKNVAQHKSALLLSAYAYLNEYCMSLSGLDSEVKKETPNLKKYIKDKYKDQAQGLDLKTGIYICMQIILYEQWLKEQAGEDGPDKHFSVCSLFPATGFAEPIKNRSSFFNQLKAIEGSLSDGKPEVITFSFGRFLKIFQKEDLEDEVERDSEDELTESEDSVKSRKIPVRPLRNK